MVRMFVLLVVAALAGCEGDPTCEDFAETSNCGDLGKVAFCQFPDSPSEPVCQCDVGSTEVSNGRCVADFRLDDYRSCCACLDAFADERGGFRCLVQEVDECVELLSVGESINVRDGDGDDSCIAVSCVEECDFLG